MLTKDTHISSTTRIFYDPSKYLKFRDENKKRIRSSRIIPPKLGDGTFGAIEVELKNPIPIYEKDLEKYKDKNGIGR